MTLLAPCRSCGGKPALVNGHHSLRHRLGCRYLAKVERRGRHGRAAFPLSPSPLQARLDRERHGPCPVDGERCAFCGFLWAGHPATIRMNPDAVPSVPGAA